MDLVSGTAADSLSFDKFNFLCHSSSVYKMGPLSVANKCFSR